MALHRIILSPITLLVVGLVARVAITERHRRARQLETHAFSIHGLSPSGEVVYAAGQIERRYLGKANGAF